MARLSPHDFEEGETHTGCTVQTLKCRRCGYESFAWSKGPGTGDEELLGYVCDEICRYREGRTQEELDAICKTCKVEGLSRARTQKPPAHYHLGKPGPSPAQGEAQESEPERTSFQNLPPELRDNPLTRRVYSLGLVLGEDCPGNDCTVYRNIFRMAQELDEALDHVRKSSAPEIALRSALRKNVAELREMYSENFAVKQFREGMQT